MKSNECQELVSEIETLRSQCELERSSVRDLQIAHTSHLQQLKSEFQSNVEMQQDHAAQVENMKKDHAAQVEKMKKDHAAQLEQSKSEFQSKLGADIEITRAMSAELESLQKENESLKTQIATISGESSKLSAENLEMSQRIEVMNVRARSSRLIISRSNVSLKHFFPTPPTGTARGPRTICNLEGRFVRGVQREIGKV